MSIAETRNGSIDSNIHKSLWKALYGIPEADHKTDVEGINSDDQLFANAFKEELNRLDRDFPENTISFIRLHKPNLYHQINEIESKLNIVWIKGQSGNSRLADFREILREWRRLHLMAAGIYAKEC
ncbi:MAG: hypothetical protein AB1499_10505, partial [Nitrospirota bacterium]